MAQFVQWATRKGLLTYIKAGYGNQAIEGRLMLRRCHDFYRSRSMSFMYEYENLVLF